MARYKLSWEIVSPSKMHKYSNADPMFYKDTRQIVPNSQIPDEDWKPVSVEFDEHELESRRDQFSQLKDWDQADDEFVRNVHLYKMPGEPEWVEIDG